jgi:predicted DNA-binding WGR domain protein
MLLHRINSEKNEARFYLVETGSSLVDPYAVIRLWGRIGGHQRGMVTPCRSAIEAEALATKLVRRKLKRGYKLVAERNNGTHCPT